MKTRQTRGELLNRCAVHRAFSLHSRSYFIFPLLTDLVMDACMRQRVSWEDKSDLRKEGRGNLFYAISSKFQTSLCRMVKNESC